MTVMASRITGQSSVCSDWQQRNIKSPRDCHFVKGIHRSAVVVSGGLPAQRDSNPENVSLWWRHNAIDMYCRGDAK